MTRRLVVPTLAGAPPQNQSLGGFRVASCESRANNITGKRAAKGSLRGRFGERGIEGIQLLQHPRLMSLPGGRSVSVTPTTGTREAWAIPNNLWRRCPSPGCYR